MTINASGVVTGGTVVDSEGHPITITGGSMTIDENGVISGTITYSGGVSLVISQAKMDHGKSVVSGVGIYSVPYRALTIAIKAGGGFAASDLAGTWHTYAFWDDSTSRNSNAPVWDRGTITLSPSGVVLGGSVVDTSGLSATITGGAFSIDGSGLVSGTVTFSTGGTATISEAKMDVGKTMISGPSTSNAAGDRALWFAVKAGGSFVTGDLAGTWHSFAFGDAPTVNSPFWNRGTITIDTSGVVTGGSGVNDLDQPFTITSGSLAITSDGLITGTSTSSSGITETTVEAKMDAGHAVMVGVATNSAGKRSIGVSIRAGFPLPTVTIAATSSAASETGNSGTFTVTRSGPTGSGLTVNFTVGGSATSGEDFTPLGTSVTIPAGATSAPITVTPIDDVILEDAETVTVTLAGGSSYTTGTPGFATVTIGDNDLPVVTILATVATAAEPGIQGVFTVSRTGPTTSALTVNYAVSAGSTAIPGVDYVALTGSVVIQAGQSSAPIALSPIDDAHVEGAETVIVTLSPNAAYVLGAAVSATVTIADNDGSAGRTLTVIVRGSIGGSVASSVVGINCPGDCSEAYSQGSTITLTALAPSGGTFKNWQGCNSVDAENRCLVMLTDHRTVTARFSRTFTDATPGTDALPGATAIRAVHFLELFDSIAALGLSVSWPGTAPAPGGAALAEQINALRSPLGLSPVSAGAVINSTHVNAVRSAVRVAE